MVILRVGGGARLGGRYASKAMLKYIDSIADAKGEVNKSDQKQA